MRSSAFVGRYGTSVVVLACAITVRAAVPTVQPRWRPDTVGGYASSHVIVRFAPHALAVPAARDDSPQAHPPGSASAEIPGTPAGASNLFRTLCQQWGVTAVRPLYPHPFAFPDVAARYGLDRTFLLDVPVGTDTPALAAALRTAGDDVEFAALDAIGTVAEIFPDDPLFCRQYGLHNTGLTCEGDASGIADADIDAPEAWMIHMGNPDDVTIAIIDSGVGVATNPDAEFLGRLVPGINTADAMNPNDTSDTCGTIGHGTGVASVAAAAADNARGIAGVAWNANIMPVRVFDGCRGTTENTIEGILWAVDNGADILNISLQFDLTIFPEDLIKLFEGTINYARDNGRLVVSAAGNSGTPSNGCQARVAAPASFAGSMAVCATDNRDQKTCFSNTGPELEVCAAGEAVYMLFRDGRFGPQWGTSFAAPHVSGLAALIKSLNPALTVDEIRAIVNATADDIGAEGFDTQTGHGRINAYAALLAALPAPRIIESVPPQGAIDARQPFKPDGGSPAGWRWFDLIFVGDTSGITRDDFTLIQHEGDAPTVTFVNSSPDVAGALRALFSARIAVEAWTTLVHLPSETSVLVGYLPGDVNGDALVNDDDVASLIEVLSVAMCGEKDEPFPGLDPLPDYSTDVDRSGRTAPGDLLRLVDLLRGAEMYAPGFLDASLPACTLPGCDEAP